MPSLRMRAWSVVRFMPRRTAAPLGPAMRHCVCFKARRMCWRSASSRVEIAEVEEAEEFKEVKEAKEGEESAAGAAPEMGVEFHSVKGAGPSPPPPHGTPACRHGPCIQRP